jgi:hypothetical protein
VHVELYHKCGNWSLLGQLQLVLRKISISSHPAEMVERSVVVVEVINSSVLGSVSLEGFVSVDNDLATSVACGTVFHKSTIIVHDHDD